MKFRTFILFAFVVFSTIFFLSCSKLGSQKSSLQIEAEQQAEQWWKSSVTKCNDTVVTKYKGASLSIMGGGFPDSMKEGYLQFKELNYVVEEDKITDADKLNGVEWRGVLLLLPIDATLRFYRTDNTNNSKWSEWMQGKILYDSFSLSPMPTTRTGVNSPFYREVNKVKGQWTQLTNDFNKIECSELPQS